MIFWAKQIETLQCIICSIFCMNITFIEIVQVKIEWHDKYIKWYFKAVKVIIIQITFLTETTYRPQHKLIRIQSRVEFSLIISP